VVVRNQALEARFSGSVSGRRLRGRTAGIPSASLFLLATVTQVFDLTPEHAALVVGCLSL
jgi:hypothetical protein